jgi:hypothetical protein
MALEQPSFPLDKLKAKLKKKYPNHNFDVASMPDTKCKVNGRCPGNRAIYYDNSGNYFCGAIIKMMDERTMEKSDKECGAYLVELSMQKAEQKRIRNVQSLR